MKKFISCCLTVVLALAFIQPTESDASSVSEIEKQIKAARKQMAEAEQMKADAARNMEVLTVKKQATEAEIQKILTELSKVATELEQTQLKIEQTEEHLIQTGIELDNTEKRISERDDILQSRVRLMYKNGFVSYLDVLLSSSSFSDLLDRFDALQSILGQDKQLLQQHKEDKALVEQQKAEIEISLAEIKDLFGELEDKQDELVAKEDEKERLIASYEEEIEAFSQVSEEQEQILIEIAAKEAKLLAEKKKLQNPYTGGKLAMPIKDSYRVTSNFGTRTHPLTKKTHTHTGIDFAAPTGTAIYAAEGGNVIVAKKSSGYGNVIIIDHGSIWTLYAHIRNGGILVKQGDQVKRGQKIAEVGNTGVSTGPHLHFEVRKNQVAVNPGGYLKGK